MTEIKSPNPRKKILQFVIPGLVFLLPIIAGITFWIIKPKDTTSPDDLTEQQRIAGETDQTQQNPNEPNAKSDATQETERPFTSSNSPSTEEEVLLEASENIKQLFEK